MFFVAGPTFFEVLEAPGTKTVHMCKMMCMYTFDYLHIMRYDEI